MQTCKNQVMPLLFTCHLKAKPTTASVFSLRSFSPCQATLSAGVPLAPSADGVLRRNLPKAGQVEQELPCSQSPLLPPSPSCFPWTAGGFLTMVEHHVRVPHFLTIYGALCIAGIGRGPFKHRKSWCNPSATTPKLSIIFPIIIHWKKNACKSHLSISAYSILEELPPHRKGCLPFYLIPEISFEEACWAATVGMWRSGALLTRTIPGSIIWDMIFSTAHTSPSSSIWICSREWQLPKMFPFALLNTCLVVTCTWKSEI